VSTLILYHRLLLRALIHKNKKKMQILPNVKRWNSTYSSSMASQISRRKRRKESGGREGQLYAEMSLVMQQPRTSQVWREGGDT
jgi:hypothetical protein